MNMADVEWTNESVVRLIEEYKKRPELWDREHDLARVQTAKYEAWASIARIFDCDIADLRKKFNSIMASHRREKGKIRQGSRSTWFLYPYLSFLSTHLEQPDDELIKTHHTKMMQETSNQEQEEYESSEYQPEDAEDYANDDDDDNVATVVVKQERPVEFVQAKSFPSLRHSKRLTRTTVKRRFVRDHPKSSEKSLIDSKLIEMLKLLRKSEISKKKDECDSFGEYIAISLRKHDDKTQSMIKQAINNILFEQEMKKYSAPPYTMVITDENPLILGEAEASAS